VGELEAAREHTEYALKFVRDTGLVLGLPGCLSSLGIIDFESGDLKSSEKYFREALEISQNNNMKSYLGLSQTWLGKVLVQKDITESDRAEKHILEGMKALEAINMKPWLVHGYFFLGELYADIGKKEKAMENLKKAQGMYQEMEIDYWPDKVKEVLNKL